MPRVTRQLIPLALVIFLVAALVVRWLPTGTWRVAADRSYAQKTGSVFGPVPGDPTASPAASAVPIPPFSGAHAIWGATGRDDGGHIWFGVSDHGGEPPSAHLFEYDPASGRVTDRGNVVEQLRRLDLLRPGEGQMKIHSRIVQADDGYLYFASMDERDEKEDGSRLPTWGGHFWRLDPPDGPWEHLFAAPEPLIAAGGGGRYVYALGYFGHVVYQYDTKTASVRRTAVGSVGGHISRNLIVDSRGHVYVPRVRAASDPVPTVATGETADERFPTTLVELDAGLRELRETPLEFYGADPTFRSHGIIGFVSLADGSLVFATHRGYLYRIVPRDGQAADVTHVGWFHPQGPAYTPSLFTFSGERYLAGVGRVRGGDWEWLVYDLQTGQQTARPLDLAAAGLPSHNHLQLYGSVTRDDHGGFYVAGRGVVNDRRAPILLRLHVGD